MTSYMKLQYSLKNSERFEIYQQMVTFSIFIGFKLAHATLNCLTSVNFTTQAPASKF